MAVKRSLPLPTIGDSLHVPGPGSALMASPTKRTRSAAQTTSWPAANTSALTTTGSSTVAFAGKRPASTTGETGSTMTDEGRRDCGARSPGAAFAAVWDSAAAEGARCEVVTARALPEEGRRDTCQLFGAATLFG